MTGAQDDLAQNLEQRAISLGSSNAPLLAGATSGPASQQWYSAMSATISQMRGVESQVVGSIIAQSRALRRGADRSALVTGIVVLSTLVLLLIVTAIIASSMVRPLRRLRAGALDVAGVRLPEKVRQLSETGGGGETFDVEPIDVTSTDEVGEVARAFDQVHREALRLAANEAMLRSNVNAMFVSLSRRSQSLVERQIKLIDELEQGEQDAERLSNLFRLDHLATRMRRNSDNLLVLAGHETVRRWGKPVTLVDVLRAAVSEIEQYKRVTLNIQPGKSVAGNAVNDVVHLLAELLENAASYSPGDTPVKVAGHLLNSGGVLLDITDQGVGMGAEEMAHANWRLENPPVVDVAVSRRMGLFVVARLAARHGIRVRLRQPELGGLTALIWLPDTLISQETTPPTTWLRRVGKLEPGPIAGRGGVGRHPSRRHQRARPAQRMIGQGGPPGRDQPVPRRASPGQSSAQVPGRSSAPVPGERDADPGRYAGPCGSNSSHSRCGRSARWWSPRARCRDLTPGCRSTTRSNLTGSTAASARLSAPRTATDGAGQRLPAVARWSRQATRAGGPRRAPPRPRLTVLTSAGLPRRVPQANIVPGSAGTLVSAAANPELSAESARNRMASFQHGVRRARAAIKAEHPSNG